MTYLDKILNVLSDEKKDVHQILKELELRDCKTVYVIDSIKKGINLNKITKHENPESKTLYKDHFYTLNNNL